MPLDPRKLEHLVAVAEEGGFTQAARRLHITQQALSTSVQALEREVGVPLLDRGSSTVTPLPAGQALIEDARVLHGVERAAVSRARRIGRGEAEILQIGHTPAVTVDEVALLIQQTGAAQSGLATEVNQRYPHELTEQLLAGELELGLCRAMSPAHGLAREVLTHHRLRVAVAADHPLARRREIPLSALADHDIIVWGRPGRSGYTELLIDHCRRAGFEPRMRRSTVQGTPPVTAVVGTDHVAFVTAEPGPAAGEQAQVLDLQPPVYVPMHALWARHVTSNARDSFLAALRT